MASVAEAVKHVNSEADADRIAYLTDGKRLVEVVEIETVKNEVRLWALDAAKGNRFLIRQEDVAMWRIVEPEEAQRAA